MSDDLNKCNMCIKRHMANIIYQFSNMKEMSYNFANDLDMNKEF